MSKFNKLSRAEMKEVMGGFVDPNGPTATCTLTVYGANYSSPQTLATSATSSSAANSTCVNLITEAGNGVYHCSYSCS